MTRAQTKPMQIEDRGPRVASPLLHAVLSALALMAAAPLVAQGSPGGFSLPEPTPSPTSAPEGPADEAAGVSIGPRVIPETTIDTAPAQQPSQAASQPAPAASREAEPPSTPSASASRPSASRSVDTSPTGSAEPPPRSPTRGPASTSPPPTEPIVRPGFDTELIPDSGTGPIGPDDWYDVRPDGETSSVPQPGFQTDTGTRSGAATVETIEENRSEIRNQVAISFGVIVLLATALGLMFWRRKRREYAETQTDASILATGVHRAISENLPPTPERPLKAKKEGPRNTGDVEGPLVADGKPNTPTQNTREPDRDLARSVPEPEQGSSGMVDSAEASKGASAIPLDTQDKGPRTQSPSAPTDPARLDVGLEITDATRSLMMLTIEIRVEVANRSDWAVRDLSLSGKLACAQRGGVNAPEISLGQMLGTVDRIGPQQKSRIAGQLQLPLQELKPIRQGDRALFIPLLHIVLEGEGQPVSTHCFVVGSPSMASSGRVHPLPFEGPPGPLPLLRAQLIKQPQSSMQKATETA